DLKRLREVVIASQRRRHLVAAALQEGAHRSWDFQPYRDASRDYVRNHLDLDDIEAAARFPRVSGAGRNIA
ncbi:MAG: choline-sulfatase, partial [Alphaproteobacteria bacterium]|nr:choline-sulfatase [Alphaproteobacteria bacterium]